MSRDDTYFQPPDSHVRVKPEWTRETNEHVKAFLKKGGKVTQCEIGESFYAKHFAAGNKHAFVINAKNKQGVKK